MNILGIDPGASTGWVVYDSDSRTVTSRGIYSGHDTVVLMAADSVAQIAVVERLVPHGASYPQVVEAAYTAGRIVEQVKLSIPVHELTRVRVRQILQEATHGAIRVKDDASVRAAISELHGGPGAFKKGGQLYGVKSHEVAALAVAVAWMHIAGGKDQ